MNRQKVTSVKFCGNVFFFFSEFIKILFIFEIPNINYLNTISVAKVFGLQVNTKGSSLGSCDLDSS
jgi:hypothetical protein